MRSLELFAGAGGLGMGAGRAGFIPAAVVDMWPEPVRDIRKTQPRAFIFENVKGLMRALNNESEAAR